MKASRNDYDIFGILMELFVALILSEVLRLLYIIFVLVIMFWSNTIFMSSLAYRYMPKILMVSLRNGFYLDLDEEAKKHARDELNEDPTKVITK